VTAKFRIDSLAETDTAILSAALTEAIKEYAVIKGDFTLKSGLRSTWFIDTKRAICLAPYLAITAELSLRSLDPAITAIGGLTMGADPIAFATATLAQTRGRELHAFSVRKEHKEYGQGGRIAGSLSPDDVVCVVEDAPSRGTSLLEAVAVIRDQGGKPHQGLAVVDRGGSVARLCQEANLAFRALLTAPDLDLPYEGGLTA